MSPNEFITGSKPITDLILLIRETKEEIPDIIRKLK